MFSTLTKKLFIVIITTFLLISHNVYACSIYIPPLRKQFRSAKQVFVGEVISVKQHTLSENEKKELPYLQNQSVLFKVSFKVKKSWKGEVKSNIEYLSIAYEDCECPDNTIDAFIPGTSYLVFNFTKDFVHVCGAKSTDSENSANKIKKLDDFGFRLWSRIYPF